MPARSVADKLGIAPNSTVWLSHPAYLDLIEPLPPNVWVTTGLNSATTALLFASDSQSITELLAGVRDDLDKPKALWVAYSKRNADLNNRDLLSPILDAFGLRANGQVALGEAWTAMRFRASKEGEPHTFRSGV